MPAHILVNVVAYPSQAVERTIPADLLADLLQNLDRAVEGDPSHHLGVRKVLRGAAYFPDALVRQMPNPSEVTQNGTADRDCPVQGGQTMTMGVIEGVE